MTRLALRNLFQRKTRTGLTLAAIASQVAFVLLLVGLTTGTLQEVGDRIENVQSDLILLPPGGQYVLSMSSAVMPLEPVRKALESDPGIEMATPVVLATTTRFGGAGMVFGIEAGSYERLGRGSFEIVQGRPLQRPNDLIVDRRLARAQNLAVGQSVEMLNHEFTISGIVKDGAGVRIYIPIETLQDLQGSRGKASLFFVRSKDPDQVDAVVESLRQSRAFKGYKVIASEQYAELLGTTAFGIQEFIGAMSVISVVFGFVVISVVMYTTILERTRQIGVLKSLGASNLYVARAFVLESFLLCLLGVPVGYGMAELARFLLQAAYPTLIITFTASWLSYATLVTVVGGVLGGLYPAFRAARVDPVVALNYE